MSDQMSLADVLNDKIPVLVPPTEAAPEAEPAAPEHAEAQKVSEENRPVSTRKRHRAKEDAARKEGEPPRDPETGKFATDKTSDKPAEEKPAEAAKPAEVAKPAVAPAQNDMTDKERAFLRAAQEERQKRQELERRLAAMEKPAEPAKQFWDDPDGNINTIRNEMQTLALNTRLNTAESIARSKYTDFDDKMAVFKEVVQRSPWLVGDMLNSPDPAQFAYTTAKNHLELQQMGNMDAIKAQVEKDTEARVRAKIEAEYKEKADAAARAREALPGSLSDARGSSNPSRPVWNGPTPLADILKN